MALLQKWDDEDVTGALEWLQEQLTANIQLLSSFEKYKKEVLSGSLDWTPMHTSQQVRTLIAVHGFICVQRMSAESTIERPAGSRMYVHVIMHNCHVAQGGSVEVWAPMHNPSWLDRRCKSCSACPQPYI